ncbi:hypothetical protein [Hydrogenophaga taeniospiralis]|uniref:hypothetical protein n=1 Tax=Hydrogenophaga taeniospiralis TaxID=65656 RepID=UPI001CF9999F|nr:hypothetical protein [Hydrogenophaga taeniospiralis]UCU93386.1 hypothetical protein KI616_21785 [Hydrogenophaga taeniospiralis]
MDPNQHGYELPEETLPTIGMEDSLEDLRQLKEFLESRGLSTANTRIDRYILYLQRVILDKEVDAATVFKNSADARFKSATDWSLYVMREVHELTWIMRGLRVHLPTGIDEKLKTILSGRDFAALDGDSRSRDAQFELRIASYFCQTGCEVRVDGAATDVVAIADKNAFYIECKRIGSRAQLGKRLIEARKQLQARMPRSVGRRLVAGCVAADVTKVAFSHNGLTLGVTNEHSRDVIQEKLVAIANDAQMYPLYQGCSGLLFHWFQIHIPAIILQPPQIVTRFSSNQVLREAVDRKQRRLARVFYGIYEAASKAKDPRERPSKPLVRKKVHVIPAGSQYTLAEDLDQLILGGAKAELDDDRFVGELYVNGVAHTFTAFDLRFVPEDVLNECASVVETERGKAGGLLLASMFANRYPYEE